MDSASACHRLAAAPFLRVDALGDVSTCLPNYNDSRRKAAETPGRFP